MEKLRRIYEEINRISPIRFAVRCKVKEPVREKKLYTNILANLPSSYIGRHEVSIANTDDLDKSVLDAMLHSDNKIDVFINGCNIAMIFDHSIADAKTAIHFCIDVLSTSCQKPMEDNIETLVEAFPRKYVGFWGMLHTLRAVVRQLFTSWTNGRTQYGSKYNRSGDYSSLNVVTRKLSKQSTLELATRAKVLSTSISSVILAAQIKMSQRLMYENRSIPIAVCNAVDLRQRCTVTPHYGLLSLCISFIIVVVKAESKDSLEQILIKVKNKMKAKVESGTHFALYKMLPPRFLISKTVVSFFLFLNEKASLLTNVGRVEAFYSSCREHIVEIDFIVPPGVNQPFSICVSTIDDEMSISIVSFNDHLPVGLPDSILDGMLLEMQSLLS